MSELLSSAVGLLQQGPIFLHVQRQELQTHVTDTASDAYDTASDALDRYSISCV